MLERRRLFLCACFATAMSGVAAMFYQLAWVRELAGVTTAATVALVLVLAAFMAGLGFGAWLGGKLAKRVARPLRAYAIVEVGAAAMFLLGIPVLSGSLHLHRVLIDGGLAGSSALTLQLVALGAYLVAATTLLGMTLPLLVAGLEYQSSTKTLVSEEAAYNLIYGINTTGAVVGCLLCGYVTIEMIGLHASILVGAAGSLASAGGAVLAREGERRRSQAAEPGDQSSPVQPRVLAVAFATGAIALATEVVWVRMLALVMLNTVYAATQVLAAVLAGIAIAGVGSAWIARRLLRYADAPARLAGVAFGALIASAIWMSCVPYLTWVLAGTKGFAGLAASGSSLKVIVLLAAILVPGSGLLAVVLPLLVAASGSRDTTQALSRLFAINTAGAVVGALAMGLWIMPMLGLGGAQLALVLAVLGAALLMPRRSFGLRGLAALASAGALGIAMHFMVAVPGDLYALRFERDEKVLELQEGVTSDVLVTEDAAHHRRIWINSAWVAGTGGGHGLLGHLPALGVDRPIERALGIALGTGQTFGAVMQQGAQHLDCVEINSDVLDLSRRWFGEFNHHLFDQPGVEVHLEDGRAFLRGTREQYDLIVLEPLQAWSAGTTALYTREFYEDARHVLRSGGVLAQWVPFYGQDTAATRAMVATAIAVFPQASLWLDEKDGILLLYNGTFQIAWPRMQRELASVAGAELLEQKHIDTRGDILSLFLMGTRGLAAWTRGADVIEDDRPFLEYAAARELTTTSFVGTLASTLAHLEDPRAYLADPSFDTLDAVRARRATITRELCPPDQLARCAAEIEADLGSTSVRVHFEYRQLILGWAELARASREARETILARGIAHDADSGEAMVNLAISLAERGQRDAASELATRAAAIPRTRAGAERVLAKLRAP